VSLRSISFAVILLTASLAPAARGDNVVLQLFPFTGEVRLTNPNPTPFTFVYYSLSSPGGALNGNPAVWKSITDVYDAPSGPTPGNGFIDPSHNWLKLSSLSTELTEGVIPNPGGSLPPYRSVSLGQIWNPAALSPAVTAEIRHPDNTLASILGPDFVIDGDYNGDDKVDRQDYDVWKQFYGSTVMFYPFWPDGNSNGIVDAADYTVWRNNLGLDLSGSGFANSADGADLGLGLGSVVPEPSTAVLLLTLAVLAALVRRSH
jgi:hypothetical protein